MKKVVINKKDLKNNLQEIRKRLTTIDDNGQKAKIIAVVKANGMGLDLVEYSKFLIANGIEILAVATIDEAIKLRTAKIDKEILMLSPVINKKELNLLIDNNITLTIDSMEQVKICEKICGERNIKAHIKIDTGFGRYGFLYFNTPEIIETMRLCKKTQITGMYTHFSKPLDSKWTQKQFNRFLDVVAIIKKNGLNPGILHCCNSTAFLLYKNMHLNAVRLGSIIQGRTLVDKREFKKVGTFVSNIVEIKNVPKGYNISYGRNYKTKKSSKIAVIPVGYIDGLNNKKSRDSFKLSENVMSVLMELKKVFKDNRLKVKIDEKEFNIIGRLGMYHAIIDITGYDFELGKEVILDIHPLNANSDIRREYI